jgi:predicted nucleic acid-binding protein
LTQFDVVDVQPGATIIHEDPDDDKFIRCALTGHAGFIITGDQHLSAINSYHSLKILSAVQFLTKYKIDS